MRRFNIVCLAAMIALFLPGLAFSQFSGLGNINQSEFSGLMEFNNLGGGARAAGMGGAYVGLAEGEMAYSWNPGSLIFAEKPVVGLQFMSVNDKFKGPQYITADSSGITTIYSTETKSNFARLNFGGFTAPFTFFDRNWAVGGGYRNVYNMEYEFETPGLVNSRNVFTQHNGVDAVSIAFAGKVIEGVGIGFTANNYIRGSETNLWIGKAAIIPHSGNTPPDTFDIWNNDNSHYSGVNFDIGLSGEFSMIKGGLVIHTPFDLKQSQKITTYIMNPPVPAGNIERATTTTSIPLGFTVGLSAKPIDKLVLAFDLDSRPMSSAEVSRNWEDLSIPDEIIDPQYENLTQFRLGAEYTLNAGFANVPIRLGFRNNPSVSKELVSDINGTLTHGDQINTNILTFGSGLTFEKAWVDFAYQFGSSSYTSTIDYGTSTAYEQKLDYSRLFISAGMNF